jgi:hypothetical protein
MQPPKNESQFLNTNDENSKLMKKNAIPKNKKQKSQTLSPEAEILLNNSKAFGFALSFPTEKESLGKVINNIAPNVAQTNTAEEKKNQDTKNNRKNKTGNLKTGNIKMDRTPQPPDELFIEASTIQEKDNCPNCGEQMITYDLERKCQSCGISQTIECNTVESSEDEPKNPAMISSRLKIVGPNSGLFQPDLDRSSTSDNSTTQYKLILDEIMKLRLKHIERGGTAFPIDACEKAADYYHDMQKKVTKRSINKRTLLANFLKHACADIKYAPEKNEISSFVEMPTRGYSRGDKSNKSNGR